MSDARRKRHAGSAKSRIENGTALHRSQAGSQMINHRGRNTNANAGNVSRTALFLDSFEAAI